MTITLHPHQQQILDALQFSSKGIVTCPTGGGKTFTMITDSRRFMQPGNVIVVVAPQLLLSQQLFNEFDEHLTDVNFMYRQISSEGKTFQRKRESLRFRMTPPKSPTTLVDEIRDTYRIAQKAQKPLILFVTYDSLNRIASAEIPITTVYYDEAHNAVETGHFQAVESISNIADNTYYFTATPKYTQSQSATGAGMNNVSVYGEQIYNVNFKDLVNQGCIVRPVIHLLQSDAQSRNLDEVFVDVDTLMETVNYYETQHYEQGAHKILVACRGTKSIQEIRKSILKWANGKGYDVLTVDSVNGGYINREQICTGSDKGKFIAKLDELGKDLTQKMIVLHYDMLGEGIDVKAFTGTLFLRNMSSKIKSVQAMGRVIRKSPGKKYGIVTVVQHADETDDAQQLIRDIVNELLSQGVPVSDILHEQSGRGKEDEVVEDVDADSLQKRINDYAIQWQNSVLLEEFMSKELDTFVL
ncbi:MAG: DEAD/DEAH box helicase [Candidatus Thorarchaeota archaeon]